MSKSGSVFLLVEDDENDVFFMERAFQDAGLRGLLNVVNSGARAIEYLDGRQQYTDRSPFPLPDLVFLDLKMPGLDGFDVLTWIRREKKLTIPVAVLTSSPEDLDRNRARELG